jgi:hypothetical protein
MVMCDAAIAGDCPALGCAHAVPHREHDGHDQPCECELTHETVVCVSAAQEVLNLWPTKRG